MAELVHCDLGRYGYSASVELQRDLVAAVQANSRRAYVLTVEHCPAVITLGRRASRKHILAAPQQLSASGIEVQDVSRGGEATYHGPGQLVAYPIVRLSGRPGGVRQFVHNLEQAVIILLDGLGIVAHRRPGATGVWVRDAKIAAIGVAVDHWVSWHGLALNVSTDLANYDLIVPCGMPDCPQTSVEKILGRAVLLEELKQPLVKILAELLGFDTVRGQSRDELLSDVKADAKPADAFLPARRGSCPAANLGYAKTGGGAGAPPPESDAKLSSGAGSGTAPTTRPRLPRWLIKPMPAVREAPKVRRILDSLNLATVCTDARCPNRGECYACGTATFLIMGRSCTRACRFCAVAKGTPQRLRADEGEAVAQAAEAMRLRHVVVTSVTRDDLPDGGAAHVAGTIHAIRRRLPEATIEVLVSDLQGSRGAISTVVDAAPDVFNHNVETVPRLYGMVRPQANYRRSLEVLATAKRLASVAPVRASRIEGVSPSRLEGILPSISDEPDAAGTAAIRADKMPASREGETPATLMGGTPMPREGKMPSTHRGMLTKSGLMVGLGEEPGEVVNVMRDLRSVGCDILTIGQYLCPSADQLPVQRFVLPDEFDSWRKQALEMGFSSVAAGPFVRSSFHAEQVLKDAGGQTLPHHL